jgi:selenoprotein W-related protein
MLRAAYMAQEFLTTFADELKSVNLQPSEISGSYKIFVNEEILFDREREGYFPEIKHFKQSIRDRVAPGRSLGHSDKKTAAANE